MNKDSVLAIVSICISTVLAVIFCVSSLCTMTDRCPRCAMQCMKQSMKCRKNAECKVKPERHHKFKMNKKQFDRKREFNADKKQQHNRNAKFQANKKQQFVRPQFKLTEEQKAQIKLFRDTVAAYKKEQTPENKAKLIKLLGKNLDKRVAMQEKRAAAMKKSAAELEKKTADMKANRDAEIEKMLQKIMNPPKQFNKKTAKPAAPAAK